ncbi:hypothetical protein MPH_00878 [Macrophomina phaseolina MS6]|uniref:Uncharacterized protein n=1 Tax=Macrophomina phaseolina (strain MS6) TaxID=1126212 RepID=K2SAN6_MACPH|nr:hypothetical protein MPH_00878 [Macrophomina phaseolina MS6]
MPLKTQIVMAPRSLRRELDDDDELLQYFSTVYLKDMVLDLKTATPLPPVIEPHIRRSRALLHAARSLSIAHIHRFEPDCIKRSMKDYLRALAALRNEFGQEVIEKHRSTHDALHRLLLGALLLAVLHAWYDDSSRDCGLVHLRGAAATLDLLLTSTVYGSWSMIWEDFLIGCVVSLDMLYSFLIPARHPLPHSPSLIQHLKQDCWRSGAHMNPICGLATPLALLVSQAGRYYRSVVDLRRRDPDKERELERSLLQWKPLDADDKPFHVQTADGYRVCGLLMFHQARQVVGARPPPVAHPGLQAAKAHQLILFAMAILRDTLPILPQPNFEAPLLLIVGSEIEKEDRAGRALIETRFADLIASTYRRGHRIAAKFMRDYWQLRDGGRDVTWLEVLVEKGLSLNLA